MNAFYLSMECENCEEEMFYGVCVTTEEHQGLPSIPYDMASQSKFVCKSCDAQHFTGDFDDIHVEGGVDPVSLHLDNDEDESEVEG
jgi:hypothetical protein